MTPGRLPAALVVVAAAFAAEPAARQQPTAAAVPAAIDYPATIAELGSFDLQTRTAAGRRLRRAPAATAAPELERAVRSHTDEYVRFRALVILSGISRDIRPLVADAMTDRNDRLRTVAYQWFEHHPDPAAVGALVAALDRERSEFVRPALTRAIAAYGSDDRARAALLPLVTRGEDLFRGALIEALGDYRAAYATAEIARVAMLEGPLQDDAITALGKIGDASARPTLVALQKTAPPEVQPTLSAAFCLLGIDCARQEAFLKESLRFALADAEAGPLLRGVVHAIGMLATGGRPWALGALVDAGVARSEADRETIALTIGLVAIRRPALLVDVLSERPDRKAAGELVLEAFDMLSEDFEEERFYTHIRDALWSAPQGSVQRAVAEELIATLEF